MKYQAQGHTVVELVFEHGCVTLKPNRLFQNASLPFSYGRETHSVHQ